jgi:hypothetical protein
MRNTHWEYKIYYSSKSAGEVNWDEIHYIRCFLRFKDRENTVVLYKLIDD